MTAPLPLGEMKTLIEALRDDTATPEQHARLEDLLRDDPVARAYYVQYQLLCADLQTLLSGDATRSLAPILESGAQNRPTTVQSEESLKSLRGEPTGRWPWWIGIAAALLIGLFSATRFVPWAGWNAPTPLGNRGSAVATLKATMDAHWADHESMAVGTRLLAEPLKLEHGLAEIQFTSGANVILQGPVECVLESPSHLTLHRGRLSAKVPVEAIGFTVRTAQATVVDLGTEFGISSEGKDATDVHVFRGQVALGTPVGRHNSRQLLGEGIAKRVEANGSQIEDIRSDELAFVGPKEFEARIKARKNSPYHQWLASSYHLRREPALVLYYTFDNPMEKPDRVINRAGATAGKLDGLLGNGENPDTYPQWVAAGRWPEQRSLRFDASREQQLRVLHCNELNITQALTIAAWIRPNTALLEPTAVIASKRAATGSAARPNYELGLIRRHDARGNAQCALYFCAAGRQIASPGIPVVPGQWMHVAVVANVDHTVLYIDGRPVVQGEGSELIPNEGSLLIGASAGRQRPDGRDVAGSFEGLISELLLVRRVLSEREIVAMHIAGKHER